jgi:hypothetical protein
MRLSIGIIVVILIGLVLVVCCGAVVAQMVAMPGKSFKGLLPPLNDDQRAAAVRMSADVHVLAKDIGARSLTVAPVGLEHAARFIEQRFAEIGYHPTLQSFSLGGSHSKEHGDARMALDRTLDAPILATTSRNIIAELKGDGASSEIIIFGAHYDSTYDCLAANDNGSGVAAMLEMARQLSGQKFMRAIRFVAFSNEEMPLLENQTRLSVRSGKRGGKAIQIVH